MKTLKNFIVNESLFNKNMLESLLVLIAGKFNKGDNGSENLITDRFGTHTDYSFSVGLDINGAGKLKIDDSEIIRRSIGHIIEGVIKASLAGTFTLNYDDNSIASQNFSLKPHTNSNDGYDFEIVDNDGNWGSAKFNVKAVASEDTDIKRMKNNVSISNNEKSQCDFFLIVEYKLNGNKVNIPAMHIFDKSLAPISASKKTHLTKTQLDNAITFVGNKYGNQ
jgi:hypothetical protein